MVLCRCYLAVRSTSTVGRARYIDRWPTHVPVHTFHQARNPVLARLFGKRLRAAVQRPEADSVDISATVQDPSFMSSIMDESMLAQHVDQDQEANAAEYNEGFMTDNNAPEAPWGDDAAPEQPENEDKIYDEATVPAMDRVRVWAGGVRVVRRRRSFSPPCSSHSHSDFPFVCTSDNDG